MGQFNSKVFDGDPYIDLMRAVPEREVTWWIQKVIWIAQGYTFLEHAARAWPPLMLHRCAACDGHGCVTCPHCRGAKLRSSAARMRFLGPDPALMASAGAAAAAAGGSAAAPSAAAAAAAAASSSPGAPPQQPPLLVSGGGAAALAAALATPTGPSAPGNEGDDEPCRHCGDFLPWDDQAAWPDRWRAWERVASYHDRSLGLLVDEWHGHEVANKSKAPPPDSPGHDYFADDAEGARGPPPAGSAWDDGPSGRAAAERWGEESAGVLAATLARFGGHPYETGDLLPFDLVDAKGAASGPSASAGLWAVRAAVAASPGGYGAGLLPPELDPEGTPALVRARPGDLPPWAGAGGGDGGAGGGAGGGGGGAGGSSAAARAFLATPGELRAEIRAQAKLAANLEAAARGAPKPHALRATAGTVPCPECAGEPWAWSWVPNFRALMGTEPPPMLKAIWARTEDRARVAGQLRAAELAAAGGGGGGAAAAAAAAAADDLPRPLLEYPTLAPDAAGGLPADPVGRRAALAVLEGVAADAARQKAARRQAAARAAAEDPASDLVARRAQEQQLPLWQRERALAGPDYRGEADAAERALSLEPHPFFGASDPLSDDWAKAGGGGGGGGGGAAAAAANAPPPPDWPARAAMPARQAARAVRDARLRRALEREGDEEGKAALDAYLARRGRAVGGGGGGGGRGGGDAA
jgi:hypothetical protein